MTHIYFVRHGLSELNVAGMVAGVTDTPLVNEGRRQAKLAGKAAKKLGIQHMICSPLSRAHETAKIIAKEIGYPEDKIEVNPMFIERNFGEREAQPYVPDFDYDGIKDAEKLDEFLSRAERAVRYLETLPYDKIMVVSHGATGRALRHHLIPHQPYHLSIKYNNAEIVEWDLSAN
jgi:probable phosphoglycerate mutase